MPSIIVGTGQKDSCVIDKAQKEREVAAPVVGDGSGTCKAGVARNDALRATIISTLNRLKMPDIMFGLETGNLGTELFLAKCRASPLP